MNFADLAGELRDLADGLEEDFVAAEERSLNDLEAECHRQSQGSLTRREIARLRPYSRKRGARLNPDIVNRHTRQFDQGWHQDGPKERRGGLESTVYNDSRVAEFFEEGTDAMLPRHPQDAAADTVEDRRFERLERVLDKYTE